MGSIPNPGPNQHGPLPSSLIAVTFGGLAIVALVFAARIAYDFGHLNSREHGKAQPTIAEHKHDIAGLIAWCQETCGSTGLVAYALDTKSEFCACRRANDCGAQSE